jgi:hypothetical protein
MHFCMIWTIFGRGSWCKDSSWLSQFTFVDLLRPWHLVWFGSEGFSSQQITCLVCVCVS